ncbi:MAG: hypothetical protein AAF541_24095 [Pseudomonadota bacterium]
MSKKRLDTVQADLAGPADEFPTQKTPREIVKDREVVAKEPIPEIPDEPTSQITLKMRSSIKDEIDERVFQEKREGKKSSVRGIIMEALRDAGFSVTDDDMIDRRKR